MVSETQSTKFYDLHGSFPYSTFRAFSTSMSYLSVLAFSMLFLLCTSNISWLPRENGVSPLPKNVLLPFTLAVSSPASLRFVSTFCAQRSQARDRARASALKTIPSPSPYSNFTHPRPLDGWSRSLSGFVALFYNKTEILRRLFRRFGERRLQTLLVHLFFRRFLNQIQSVGHTYPLSP